MEFTEEKKPVVRKGWADDESSEDEEDEAELEENEDSDEEEDDEEKSDEEQDDEINDNLTSTTSINAGRIGMSSEVPTVPKEKSYDQLSKKERKELRMRELNALNSLLEEFIPPPIESASDTLIASQQNAEVNSIELSASQSVIEAEKQKKKKKKKSTKENVEASSSNIADGIITDVTQGIAETIIETEVLKDPTDISEVLKNRVKAKKSTKSKTEALKVAEAEALKAIAKGGDKKKEKKKKDKKNYNEMSHYN